MPGDTHNAREGAHEWVLRSPFALPPCRRGETFIADGDTISAMRQAFLAGPDFLS